MGGLAWSTDVVETTRRGHAAEIARDAVADYDVVAVLAGDGTLNEAGGGLAGSAVALAPLPGGSTNVFARTLGIAYDAQDATRQLVDSLRRDVRRRIGLVTITAVDVSVRHFLPPRRRLRRRHHPAHGGPLHLKRHSAHPAFAVATVDTWLRHFDRSQAIRLAVDVGTNGSWPPAHAVISNSDPYTYVGHRP